MHDIQPFSIPAMRSFVPEKLRPWIVLIFVFIFQLSGGVYLAAVSEMVGSLSLLQEDVMMAGAASLVGLALTFAVMFRLKFRFPSKVTLLTCASAIVICNLICMHTRSVPVLVGVCFICGIFRMWGTFECNSTIQLWLTPKRDLSIFFCFIELLVQGSMQFSGLMAIYTAFFSKWESFHWLIIALLLAVMAVTVVVYRNFRTMPKLPLFGIDWLGALLWAVTVMSIIFVLLYGEHYDWLYSIYIRMGIAAAAVSLALNLWRASFIRHPFIPLHAWTYHSVYMTVILYLLIELLLAPGHLFEHIFMEAILEYDTLNLISLNWASLLGIVAAALFTYQTFALRKWRYKPMMIIGFGSIVAYLAILYFTIDYNLPKSALILPVFLRSFGHVVFGIIFLTILARVPFDVFFQTLTIQAFFSACIGGFFGSAVLSHLMKAIMKKNAMLIASDMDDVNQVAGHINIGELYGVVQRHALIVSMKEIYGILLIIALGCMLVLLMKESTLRPKELHPKYKTIRKFFKHQLRQDQPDK